MELPDKAIIIARLKKKGQPERDPESDGNDDGVSDDEEKGEGSDKLTDIAHDLLDALKNKDAEALRDFLCEFIDAHTNK